MSIEISQWNRQIGILNNCTFFSNATISFYFSIRDLLIFFLIFPCHTIFLKIYICYFMVFLTQLRWLIHFLYLQIPYFILFSTHYLFHLWICELQVILKSAVELSPGPKPNSGQNFSVCHLNLSSIPVVPVRKFHFVAPTTLYRSSR